MAYATIRIRDGFIAQLRSAGFDVPDSFTNFALIRFPDGQTAQRADTALKARGVFLRLQTGADLPNCLRATISTQQDMTLASSLLTAWAEEDRA